MSSNKGVRIIHDFDDFMEDRDVVLTLKDTYILGGQDVNDDADVLENIEMAEQYKRQALQDTKTKKDELLDAKYGGEKKILPQYDAVSTEKEGITLDSYGEYNLDRIRKIDSIKAKLASGPKKGGSEISLDTPKNIASEYYTSEEMKKFKKPSRKVTNVQKSKEDIVKFLEDSLGDSDEHHGSRDARKNREKADLDDAVTKKQKIDQYESALKKAREQSKAASYIDEEYESIQRSIENQRRAAQSNKVNKVEDVVRALIDTNKTANTPVNKDYIVLDSITKKNVADADTKVVELDTINTATDFLKTVPPSEEIRELKMPEPRALSIKNSRDGTASVVNISLPSEKILAWNKSNSALPGAKYVKKEKDTSANQGEKADEKEDDLYNEEEIEKLVEERKNILEEDSFEGGGLMNALKAAREKGYLMESEIEVAGRSKDKTYREELSKFKDSNDKVRLEYRDKQGRIMTPKEAFRYQCRIFHGIAPSKNKQEKERKRYEAGKKLLATSAGQSASMKALNKLQQQGGQAYVVLDMKKQQ